MQTVKLSALLLLCILVTIFSGCNGEQQYKDMKIQNNMQRKHISKLESELQATKLEADKLKRILGVADGRGDITADALRQQLAAMEENLAAKRALIAKMQQQLIYGGASLPVELNTMLEDFATAQPIVTYDASRGIVKFKSDLLFERGSDVVAPAARKAVGELCKILNSEQAKDFDVIIAGHTDDMRIGKAQTRRKHPTNWHLSSHRAISVLNVMTNNNMAPGRLSARGFGEYRPIAPNKPNKKGNPVNRRVEIYIVPKGI